MNISIQIPKSDKILIKEGQMVDFNTPFVAKKKSTISRVPVADLMSSNKENIYKIVKKTVGQHVKKGEVLAEEKGLFNSKKYISQISGTLVAIDEGEGVLIIETQSQEPIEIYCNFNGEVANIYDTHIEIKVKHGHRAEIIETDTKIGAPIYYDYAVGKSINEDDIEGKFMASLQIDPVDHAKVKTLGARGIIGLKKMDNFNLDQIILTNEKDWEHLLNKKFPFMLTDIGNKTIIFYE